MSGFRSDEDALFDDLAAEEERMAAEEQAELDAEDDETADPGAPTQAPLGSELDGNDPAAVLALLDKLKSENEEMKDRTLRTVAEMENLRRRTAREIADTRAYAVANFARDLLAVGDNLQRALLAVTAEKRESGSEEFKNLLEGVELTQRELLKALDKAGVVKFSPEGQKFDPNLHQAMFEMPNPDVPNNSVAQVVQEGYTIGDRVLRPAMVGVAKGGPKWEESAQDDAAESVSENNAGV